MVPSDRTYDFVIVGGGTSGLVVASRLSEDPSLRVLVIEAGANNLDNPAIKIPALWLSLLGTSADWDFVSTKQKLLDDRVVGFNQGRMLGGSSALNTQVFNGPSEVGINSWSELGNPGWDWQTLRPYYQKCYTLSIPQGEDQTGLGIEYLKEDTQSNNGPLKVTFTKSKENELGGTWVETFKSLNYGLTGDPHLGASTGGFCNPTTLDDSNMERSYAASAYYAPASQRPNLDLLCDASVQRILLEDHGKGHCATGVVVQYDGIEHIFKASKEVILAAGAFNTPKILELSGIGDPHILQKHGIETIVERPGVGENFHDHPMAGVSFEVKDDVRTLDSLNRQVPEAIQEAITAYQTSKSGAFSRSAVNTFAYMPQVDFHVPGGAEEYQRFLNSHEGSLNSRTQDVEIRLLKNALSTKDKSSGAYFMYAAQGTFGSDIAKLQDVAATKEGGKYISVCSFLSYPLSRGSVHIQSSSATDAPAIDPAYFANPVDLELFARHLRFIETLVSTEPLAGLLKGGGRVSPVFAPVGKDLDTYKDYIRRTMITAHHPVGTCAMRPEASGGVIDPKLIVYGTTNLRVVDASMIPIIVRGNTQSTVYAVAERAADLIKANYNIS